MTDRVGCVLPAYDVARTIPAVASGLRAAIPQALLVAVDDGSLDETGDVARRWCDVVIRFDANRGKGAALRAGYAAALEAGCDRVLSVDADGQHDPRSAPALLAALDHADLAIGARTRFRSAMPLGRRVTNALSDAAVSRCAGRRVTDSQSGFRAARAELLRHVSPRGERFEFETEFLIVAARLGWRIATVPVPTLYGGGSHFRPLRDGARVVRTIWRHRPAGA